MDFIDLSGASGPLYRFRRWPAVGSHPPIAGNYALVAERGRTVIALGVADNLSRASFERPDRSGAVLFTRLNVARRTREAEHADLAQQHPEAAGALATETT